MTRLNLKDIRAAHQRIGPYINTTPVLICTSLNHMAGAPLFFKCENFQKTGAFKFRGACNAVFLLSDEEASRGVVTHSSGNFAAALALAASKRGTSARIVMPSNAPEVKVAAVKGYGGIITFCEPTLKSRETTAQKVIEETGATFIHPYNDFRIIAGQGTAALELMEEIPDLDFIVAPVGGGGLLSGTAIAAKGLNPKIKVIGCEPKNADDAYRSMKAGRIIPSENPNTIADGLKTSLGDKTFPIIRGLVDEILLATEEEIISAMRHTFERMKIVAEPSAAVPLAVLLSGQLNVADRNVGVVISGGNVDLGTLFEYTPPTP
ncbi:MAG: pyridoxal-phosphate dependent enzyme [Candidatus Zixiibacteriota bacterium]|nr:MAG: pyridoxal-phosphate dependent enzyme [candidate division Zixibacteria bacterium]